MVSPVQFPAIRDLCFALLKHTVTLLTASLTSAHLFLYSLSVSAHFSESINKIICIIAFLNDLWQILLAGFKY